jgi:hypothetical protein
MPFALPGLLQGTTMYCDATALLSFWLHPSQAPLTLITWLSAPLQVSILAVN